MRELSEEQAELAIDFALGLCEGERQRLATRLMDSDYSFASEVHDWQERLHDIDLTADEHALPANSWPVIAASLDRRPTPIKAVERILDQARALWSSPVLWRPLALALGVLLLIGSLIYLVPSRPPLGLIAVLETPEGRPAAIVTIGQRNEAVLIPLQAVAPAEGKVLEVWTLQSRFEGPVSIGRMASARRLTLDLSKLRPVAAGHLFEVTIEPAGGSPTGRPTGLVVMKGLASTTL